MIDLTPLDVRKKKGDLKRSLRGYDPSEVDGFLELVADRLEELVRENRELLEKFSGLQHDLAAHREKEKALTEALVTAQEMRADLRRQADKDAELVRREAESAAAQIRVQAEAARAREEEAMRRVRARRAQFLHSYRAFLERELSEVSVIEEAVLPALPSGRGDRGGEEVGPDAGASPDLPPADEGRGSQLEAELGEPSPPGEEPPAGEDTVPAEEPDDLGWLSSIMDEEQT